MSTREIARTMGVDESWVEGLIYMLAEEDQSAAEDHGWRTMLGALLFGLAASSALVIGGVAGAFWRPPRALVAAALAFASGALITALAFDLFEESFKTGGVWFSGLGLLAGAAAFVVADEWLDRRIEGAGVGVPGFAILAAVTLDGIPENMALGVTLLEGTGSVVLLVAIFASNLPEGVGLRVQITPVAS
jgi:zinc transporter, ZIP family